MANKKISSLEDFVKVHGILLAASGLPQKLYASLFRKLASDTLDGGAHFQIEPCDDARRRRLVLTSESMPKDSDVFLIDHAWTFRLPDAYKQVGGNLLQSKYKMLQEAEFELYDLSLLFIYLTFIYGTSLSNDVFLVYCLIQNELSVYFYKKIANSFL